jgi:hypothetical protein
MGIPLRQTLASAAGIIAAITVLEMALRPLASANLPPIAEPGADSAGSSAVTSRQMEEGIAEAHFSAAGARLTGNATIAGARSIVILGDSHVMAREVADSETMGSWIERLARTEHHLVNVRQYGWRGASPPQYLLVAPQVIARWHPEQVVVVLDGDDLGADPLNRRFPRMRIGGLDSVEIVTAPRGTETPAASHHYSTLVALVRLRSLQILARAPRTVRFWLHSPTETRGPQPSAAMIAAVPRAEVKALARAFGPGVLIVYTADVRVIGGDKADPGEARLLIACAEQGVRCVSMRTIMLNARSRGRVSRGFSTTTLGVGHLNATGHALVGHAVWDVIRPGAARPTTQIAKR